MGRKRELELDSFVHWIWKLLFWASWRFRSSEVVMFDLKGRKRLWLGEGVDIKRLSSMEETMIFFEAPPVTWDLSLGYLAIFELSGFSIAGSRSFLGPPLLIHPCSIKARSRPPFDISMFSYDYTTSQLCSYSLIAPPDERKLLSSSAEPSSSSSCYSIVVSWRYYCESFIFPSS